MYDEFNVYKVQVPKQKVRMYEIPSQLLSEVTKLAAGASGQIFQVGLLVACCVRGLVFREFASLLMAPPRLKLRVCREAFP